MEGLKSPCPIDVSQTNFARIRLPAEIEHVSLHFEEDGPMQYCDANSGLLMQWLWAKCRYPRSRFLGYILRVEHAAGVRCSRYRCKDPEHGKWIGRWGASICSAQEFDWQCVSCRPPSLVEESRRPSCTVFPNPRTADFPKYTATVSPGPAPHTACTELGAMVCSMRLSLSH